MAEKDRLLIKDEREACIPTDDELTKYLATPDDEVAARLRKELPEYDFRKLGFFLLYNENCMKAQHLKDQADKALAVEQARKDAEVKYKKALVSSLPPRYLRKVIEALQEGK